MAGWSTVIQYNELTYLYVSLWVEQCQLIRKGSSVIRSIREYFIRIYSTIQYYISFIIFELYIQFYECRRTISLPMSHPGPRSSASDLCCRLAAAAVYMFLSMGCYWLIWTCAMTPPWLSLILVDFIYCPRLASTNGCHITYCQLSASALLPG